ncbi:hypothetical protein JZ751_017703 [Albula glossodonta]|uniref:Uncharacterized protein n=1 Tax=Albula glossodonta TaxID=121402 RepID=A0A8T2PP49_9TELE|nr:hypothetical protein JZ751_017703 [Albula glossodonta]
MKLELSWHFLGTRKQGHMLWRHCAIPKFALVLSEFSQNSRRSTSPIFPNGNGTALERGHWGCQWQAGQLKGKKFGFIVSVAEAEG